jgi:recombination protein RecA
VRLDIRRRKAIKRGEEVVGNEVKVKVVKNKVAPPFREAEFEILFGYGVNRTAELIDSAEKHGLVEKTGAWYSFCGEKLGQGRDKAMVHLDEHPDLAKKIRALLHEQVRAHLAGAPRPPQNGA